MNPLLQARKSPINPRKATAVVALLLINQLAFADASYESTTQITGGSLVETMQKVSFLSHSIKDMLAPITTTTIVHGNQKAVVSKDSTEITDLDRECIIRIDNLKKTYTVITFAEMRQAFLNMPKQMDKMQEQMKQAQANQPHPQQPSDIKTTFDVKVNNTGVTKVVNGLEAQEQVITMTMKVTMTNPPPPPQGQPADPNAPTSMDYTVTTDTWVAPDPPEIKEIADFDIRFGQKLMQGVDMKEFAEQMKQMQAAGNAATAQLLGGQPGAGDAMAQMAKEMAKLKGTRVLEVTSMGGLAPAGTATASDSTTPPPSGQSVAGDVATNTATQTASGEASQASGKTGIFTNALTSSVLGGFHHKKAAPAPAPATPPPTTASGTPVMQTVVLMATTTQKTNFSQSPVSPSVFQIPPGFKKVPSPMASMGQ
jgi:hypothetical protein